MVEMVENNDYKRNCIKYILEHTSYLKQYIEK